MGSSEIAPSGLAPGKRTRLVVGIDFGTTFSGYFQFYSSKAETHEADYLRFCWAIEGAEEEMQVIREWPGKGNSPSSKQT